MQRINIQTGFHVYNISVMWYYLTTDKTNLYYSDLQDIKSILTIAHFDIENHP